MGKIKGWSKHRTDPIWWSDSDTSIIDIGRALIITNNKSEFSNKIYIINISKNHKTIFTKRTTKTNALKIAIRYMRTHPRG